MYPRDLSIAGCDLKFDNDRDDRDPDQGTPVCKELPQHLLELIVLKYGQECASSKDLLNLRLVSKAWRSAVQEYGGSILIDVQKSTDLFGVCKFLPAMSSLFVYNLSLQVFLHPLSSLSRLTHLDITKLDPRGVDNEAHELLADLLLLPASLRDLVIWNCHVDPACFKHVKCVELTKLDVYWTTNTAAEICDLLQHLPKLKVTTSVHPTSKTQISGSNAYHGLPVSAL